MLVCLNGGERIKEFEKGTERMEIRYGLKRYALDAGFLAPCRCAPGL